MFVFYIITWSMVAGTVIGVIVAILVNFCVSSSKKDGQDDSARDRPNFRAVPRCQIPVGAVNA